MRWRVRFRSRDRLGMPKGPASWALLSGQSCGNFSGEWHFVNNQIPRGTGECSLLAVWSTGDMCDVGPTTVNKKTQHFNCVASGELLSATKGDCPGKLVLSDFDCDSNEPPCEPDPKTGECPKDPDPK
jgi:hypothetical protein